MMRTFSALREHCNYPELIDMAIPMSVARGKACDVGTEFHGAVESWVKGEPIDALSSKDARTWLAIMEKVWSPPPGCKAEIAMGITDDGRSEQVDEPEPHVYVSRRPDATLITAGRLDLLWTESDGTQGVVVDVKTGRSYLGDPWRIPQLVAQAVAVALRLQGDFDNEITQIKLGVYYARLGLFDYGEGPRVLSEVVDMFHDVKRWALAANDPKPGAWCLSCYSASNCNQNPARKAG